MTLQELLRSHSREINDSIRNTKSLIEGYRTEKQAAFERARRAKADVEASRGASEEQAKSIRLVQSKIAEIEIQLQELRARLQERQEELKRYRQQQAEVSSRISELRKGEQGAEREVEISERKVAEAESSLQRDTGRLSDARRVALSAYLDGLWGRLLEHSASAEQRRSANETRSKFEQQRHQDPGLAGLWEAREEWRKIANSSAPTLVLQTAKSELVRVEAKIDERLPGIFDALAADHELEEIEELFFHQQSGSGAVWIPLPVPEAVWTGIAEGGTALAEELAMRMVWSIAKAVPPSAHLSEFGVQTGHSCLRTQRLPDFISRTDPLVLELPGGSRVEFIVSPFPSELAEVFDDENLHK